MAMTHLGRRDFWSDLRRIAAGLPIRLPISTANVSSPPTDAQLDAAFGQPADCGDGFIALVDDAGAGTTVWFVGVLNSKWWYEQLTAAV